MQAKINFLQKFIKQKIAGSFCYSFTFCLMLSWVYALCEQIVIPLPFYSVPVIVNPLPIYICTLWLGWPAVYAYGLYLLQGVLGAPFFAGMLSGAARLIAPAGGYIVGFGLAAIFLACVREYKKQALFLTLLKIYSANILVFACGLVWLNNFVPTQNLLAIGLYPFIIGDFVLKAGIAVFVYHNYLSMAK